jgi:hypothetical protein
MTRRLHLTILAIYVVLALIYGSVNPPLEAPDENYHYEVIRYIALNGTLPPTFEGVETRWHQEGMQPPLYYLVASLLAGGTDPNFEYEKNPFAQIGVGLADHNNRFFLPIERGNDVAMISRIRLFSTILGAIAVYAIYRSVSLAVDKRTALLAMGIVAFNPQFIFITSSINNDNAVTALAALIFWVLMLILQRGFTWQRVAILAVLLPLAALSKLSGLTLYVMAGATFALMLFTGKVTFRRAFATGILLIAAFGVIAAWWYIRNVQLYGDITGTSEMIAIIGARTEPYTVYSFLTEMEGLRISGWALFGWFNVIGPMLFLRLMDVLTFLGMVGGVLWVSKCWRERRFESLHPVGLLALHFAITFVSLILWTRRTPGTQGRLLFASLTAISMLLAIGWIALAERVQTRWWAFTPLPVMIGVAVLTPFLTIMPTYAEPPATGRMGINAVQANVSFDDFELRGFRIYDVPIRPGESLPIALFYNGTLDKRAFFITVFDQVGNVVGKIDTYPGGGNMPRVISVSNKNYFASHYEDWYNIPISADAAAPAQFRVEFGVWDVETRERIQARDADGKPLESVILRGGTLVNYPPPPPRYAQTAVFADAFQLDGYDMSGNAITFHWRALRDVADDWNIFVQIQDESGEIVTQADGEPFGGAYPTSAWAVNAPFAETRTVPELSDLTPGRYRVVIGFYRLSDFTRLPVTSGGSSDSADSVTLDTWLEIGN